MLDLSYAREKPVIENANIHSKKVLLRVDFNVPINNGVVLDDSRIREAIETIQFLLTNNKVIILSHLKRPKGWDKTLTLRPIASVLSQLINQKVYFFDAPIGSPQLKESIKNLEYGTVALLENIRFYEGETLNDGNFSKELSLLGDVFVNDAFGTMHRAHASTEGVAQLLPSYCGFLVKKELHYVQSLVSNAKSPLTVIMGGGKTSTKIKLLEGLLKLSQNILIGGGMVFTFLKAMGFSIGNSLFEEETFDAAKQILKKAKNSNCNLIFPLDIICAKTLKDGVETISVNIEDGIPDGYLGLDIGSKTQKLYADIILKSKTIFWNGPLGVFEIPPFDKGTKSIAKAIGDVSSVSDVMSIVGGGESAMAARLYNIEDKVTFISTGGGALLEMLEGVKLPGIMAIGLCNN